MSRQARFLEAIDMCTQRIIKTRVIKPLFIVEVEGEFWGGRMRLYGQLKLVKKKERSNPLYDKCPNNLTEHEKIEMILTETSDLCLQI